MSRPKEFSIEMVDKFHKALCPHCGGKCPISNNCGYDYSHTINPKPDINLHWEKYLKELCKYATKNNLDLEEVYTILTSNEDSAVAKDSINIFNSLL